jgi:peptidoglycan/xylan/chitin deacetylase (PgdA/CDA1 family)
MPTSAEPVAAPGQTVVNVTFHGVGVPPRPLDPGEADVWLSREEFEAALDVIASRAAVRVSFDDGNLSDATIALPALLERGLTAAFFLPAGLVGRPGRLHSAHIRVLIDAGMTIGSHGLLHRAWPSLSASDLDDEIVGARDRLEDIVHAPVVEAACPFGAYDRRTLDALSSAGFERVYTSDRGPTRTDAWLQARNTVHRGDGPQDVRRAIESRAGPLASIARAAKLAVKRWR